MSEGYGFIFSLQFTKMEVIHPILIEVLLMYALSGEGASWNGGLLCRFSQYAGCIHHDPQQGMIALIDDAFGW
ncbi:MAG: hypothetical protein CM15mP58_18580 [Burkholderiaceae bacterium]|nr:MAG: hypothetical protein CM15mP58_18580 [Burkholderiaceae bacterium]